MEHLKEQLQAQLEQLTQEYITLKATEKATRAELEAKQYRVTSEVKASQTFTPKLAA